jgi:hypothetical protein
MLKDPDEYEEAERERFRVPRTLEEAFGPGAKLALPKRRRPLRERVLWIFSIVLLLGCLILLCALHSP